MDDSAITAERKRIEQAEKRLAQLVGMRDAITIGKLSWRNNGEREKVVTKITLSVDYSKLENELIEEIVPDLAAKLNEMIARSEQALHDARIDFVKAVNAVWGHLEAARPKGEGPRKIDRLLVLGGTEDER